MDEPTGFVTTEVVRNAPDYLLQVRQEAVSVFQVEILDCSAFSFRACTKLDRHDSSIHDVLTSGPSRIPGQTHIGSQVLQKTFSALRIFTCNLRNCLAREGEPEYSGLGCLCPNLLIESREADTHPALQSLWTPPRRGGVAS